jgi:hypothetical protein
VTTFTQTFGGNTIYPSDVSYLALALSANTTLEWPLEASTGSNIVARIIDVTPTAAYSITMPDATLTGVGQTILFNNLGPYTVTVKSSTGTTLISLSSGTCWELYLYNNSTATGLWRTFQFGASTAQAQASALAGAGLDANGSLLEQATAVTTFNANYSAGTSDRASAYVWTGGVGTLSLPSASSVGNNWFMSVRNGGTGNLTIDPSGSETINEGSTLVLLPDDSATIVTDGSEWWTLGLGQSAVFAFDYTSISLTGQSSPYALSGSELNRITYDFVGVLTANMEVVVPKTTQQYWIANDTTGGSYTLSVRTSTQSPALLVTRGSRGIYYCNGTDLLKADTQGISTPVAVSEGGTGSTTAGGALINLGGTSVGIAVFNAASQAAGQAALGTQAVGYGGTGLTTFTTGDLMYASGSATLSKLGIGSTGQSLRVVAGAPAWTTDSSYAVTTFSGGTTGLLPSSATSGAITLTGTLAVANGGTNITSYTTGDILYASASGVISKLGIGTNGQQLVVSGGLPAWTSVSGSVTTISFASTGLTPSTATSGAVTVGGTLVVANGGTGATTLTGIVKGNGTSAFTAATVGTDYVAPGTATTFTAKQTFSGSSSVNAALFTNAAEVATVSATAATGTINYDVSTQSVLYYTSSAAANWTVNLRHSSGTTMNTALSTGQCVTVVFLVTQGSTAYYNNIVQVDGTTSGVTTKWQNAAPSVGNASSVDAYSYTIIKTGASTFTVLASQTKFA